MNDNEMKIILKLVDEFSDKAKKALGLATAETKKVGDTTKKVEKQSKESWVSISLTIMGAYRAARFFIDQIKEIVKVGREADPVINKTFTEFENTVHRAYLIIAENLKPQILLVLGYWTEFLNKRFTSGSAASGFADDLKEVQNEIMRLMQTPMFGQGKANEGVNAEIVLLRMKAIEIEKQIARNKEETNSVLEHYSAVQEANFILAENTRIQKENDSAFLAGKISQDQYISGLQSVNATAIREAQIRMQAIDATVKAQELAYDKDLIAFIKAENAKKKAADDSVKWQLLTHKQQLDATIGLFAQLETALAGAAAQNKKFAEAAKAVSIALIIMRTASGIMKAYEEFGPFGVAAAAVVAAAGALQLATAIATKFHSGGVVKAHSGLAVDEVPAILQTGEGVLSRRGMSALGGTTVLNSLNAGGGGSFGDINIFIQGGINPGGSSVSQMAEELGFAFEREVRTARGF